MKQPVTKARARELFADDENHHLARQYSLSSEVHSAAASLLQDQGHHEAAKRARSVAVRHAHLSGVHKSASGPRRPLAKPTRASLGYEAGNVANHYRTGGADLNHYGSNLKS